MFPRALIVLLGWGALAFGAEYAWAYAPLMLWSVFTCALALRAGTAASLRLRGLYVVLGLMLLAVGTQLVPMPRDAAEGINGAAAKADYAGLSAAVLGNADRPQDSEASSRYRAISIAPSRTALGLVFVAIVVGLFITCARAMSVVGHRTTVRGIVVLGVVVAFLQLIQSASGSDVVYGFWVPPTEKGHHSAPFLNRNHTAGWLLMALSVSLGRFAGLMSQWPLAGRRWRQRLLSLSDAGPSEAVLTAVGVGVMAVAIVSTASRSGLACLAVAVAMAVAWSGRARLSIPRRAAVALYAIAALLFALSQDVVARVVGRLSTTTWTTLDGRLDVWRDSLDIIRDTPWVGTGLNTYGIAMLHYQTVDDGLQYIEAHNDYLQLFAEGGLLLVIPLVLVLLFFVREVRRRFREGADTAEISCLRAGAVTGLVSIAAQEVVDFTLQMPGAAVLFVVLAAIAIHKPCYLRRQPSTSAVTQQFSG